MRTRDIETHFEKLLWKLAGQTLQPSELVVVDNFSSESRLSEMINLLMAVKRKAFKDRLSVKIVPLTDEEFSYASSVNVGVFVSDCDLVCITNGHCLPLSKKWLESGVRHFAERDIAGVAGYVLPHRDGTFWEKLVYDWGWRRINELSKFYAKDDFFSTVNCILRRSLWEKYPFDERMPKLIPNTDKFGGEDYDWGLEMLARGYKLVVEPRFDVYHSHGETILQLIPKYSAWYAIQRAIRKLRRPRRSFTTVKTLQPRCLNL